MNPEEIALETAKLGIEAESFLSSSLGKYLMDRAELHIMEHTAKLVVASPDDIKANTDCRVQIEIAQLFQEWLVELVNAGHMATNQIHEMESFENAH